jgi:O-antigen ligase
VHWLLLLAWSVRNTVFVRQRASNTFAAVDAAAGVQIGIVAASALTLLASGRLGELLGNHRSPLQVLLLYYVVCAISAIWSPMPLYSFYRASEAFVLVASAASAMMMARDQRSAERTLLLLALITVLLSMAQNVRLHGFAAMATLHAWHTNTYTAVAALCLVYAFGEHRSVVDERRRWLSVTVVLSLAAVVVGTSSAGNVSAAIGLLVVALVQRRYGFISLLLVALGIATAVLISLEGSVFEMLSWLFPGKDVAAVESLGGRAHLWELYWDGLRHRPMLGHGFGVLGFDNGGSMRLNSHNAFIAAVLSAGMLGGALAVVFFWRLLKRSIDGLGQASPGAIGGAAALVTALVNSNSMPLFLEMWEESNLVSTALIAYLVCFVWNIPAAPARRGLLRRG